MDIQNDALTVDVIYIRLRGSVFRDSRLNECPQTWVKSVRSVLRHVGIVSS